ncbi:putative protein-like [Capsicum annuum]|nr:putative protein-like [Capsicum annuum]
MIDNISSNKFDELLKLRRYKRYLDNDSLANNIHSDNKRIKFSYDDFSSNKLPCLKMVDGSLYLPKDNPKKPLGEDAHFIQEPYQTIGVADGVGHVKPKKVLQEAYNNTNYEGSSTACIITLNSEKNTICAANVGDSVYKSSIQQRGLFGCPYQLGKCRDNPSVAKKMELNIEKDDILIVGTDGMLDNMNQSEIEEIVRRGIA